MPLSTSAPSSPRTVGAGNIDYRGLVEYPTLDALATVTTPADPKDVHAYPSTEVPSFDMQVGYGLTDHLDLEVGVGGAITAIVPVPHSTWAGFRRSWRLTETTTLGVAGRIGYAGFWAETRDDPRAGSTVSLMYAGASLSAERELSSQIRLLGALATTPAWVRPKIESVVDDLDAFFAAAFTTTLAITYRNIGPYVSAGLLNTSTVRGLGTIAALGVTKTF